jgi:hypothetical protein
MASGSAWHKSAPRPVRDAYRAGRRQAGWKAWRRHLRLRTRPRPPADLFAGGWRALGWGLDSAADSLDFAAHSLKVDQASAAEELREWLGDDTGRESPLDYALSALGWCHCLPELAAVVSAKRWWALLERLLRLATAAEAAEVDGAAAADGPLIDQLLAGELALTLAYLFPEIGACRALRPNARRLLSRGLIDLLDDRGLPRAAQFDRLRAYLACWTRCRALADRWRRGRWSGKAQRQYRRLVLGAMRLTRRDGSHVFAKAAASSADADLLRTAMAFAGGSQRGIGVLPDFGGCRRDARTTRRQNGRREARAPGMAAMQSQRAAVAVMRPDWSRSSPRLTVFYAGTSCRVELACGKDVLLSGPWGLEVTADGGPLAATSTWSQICWLSDKDVDYLELEIELGGGFRVQRHLVLARKDRFLLLADAVLCPRPSTIQYRGTLPLWPGVTFREACETREGMLVGHKPRAVVLPLALPEWLADRRGGELRQTAAGLQLRQAAAGQALFAPLFVDLDRRRMAKPLTWRQLTVAESGTIQSPDAAVGYRVAIGRRQWLLYRSLTAPRNRSVLGHNLSTETLVARFARQGEVEPLVEIQ